MKTLLSSKRFQRGFTLIELLIVVAIISVLVSMGAFSYSTAMRNSRDAQRKADLKKIALALEKYYTDNGTYPPGSNTDVTSTGAWITGLPVGYMTEVPKDPKNSGSNLYRYIVFNSGQNYLIMANLENDGDNDRRRVTGAILDYSPCNEQPYHSVPNAYIDPNSYDWCVSDPK